MTSLGQPPAKYAWKFNATAQLDQIPPVANTWYPVLDTTLDVAVLYLTVFQENDETDAKTLEFKATVDGETVEGSQSAIDNTWYYVMLPANGLDTDAGDWTLAATTAIRQAGSSDVDQSGMIRAQSLKFEVRQTTAVGTNQELRGRVGYWTLEET